MTTKNTPKKQPALQSQGNEKPMLGIVGNTLWILANDSPTDLEQTLTISEFEQPLPIEWVSNRNAFLTQMLTGYNLLENGDFTDGDKKSLKGWTIDTGQSATAGVDLSEEWHLTEGHTAYLLAAEDAPRPGFSTEQKIPVISNVEYRFSGFFTTQRADGFITLFCYDENHHVLSEEHINIPNSPEYSGGKFLKDYAYIESVFTPVNGTQYLQFKIELGEQIDLSQANGYLFFTELFLGIKNEDDNIGFHGYYSPDAYRLSWQVLQKKSKHFGKIKLPERNGIKQITVNYGDDSYQVDLAKTKKLPTKRFELSAYHWNHFLVSIAKACENKNWAIGVKLLEKWLNQNPITTVKHDKSVGPVVVANHSKYSKLKTLNDEKKQAKQKRLGELYIFSEVDSSGIHRKGIFNSPTVEALFLIRQLSEIKPTDPRVWLWLAQVTYSLQRWKECIIAYNTLKTLRHSFDEVDNFRFAETLAKLHQYEDVFHIYLPIFAANFENKFLDKLLETVNQCDDLKLSSEALSILCKINRQKIKSHELIIQIIPRLCIASLVDLLEQPGDDGYKLVLQALPNAFDNAEIINDWTIPLTLLKTLDSLKLLYKLPDWLSVESVWMGVQLEKLLVTSDKMLEPHYRQALTKLKGLSIWSKVVEFDKEFPLLDADYLRYGQTWTKKPLVFIRSLSEFLTLPESKAISPHILLDTQWYKNYKPLNNKTKNILVDFFRYSNNSVEKLLNPNDYFDCDWYQKNYLTNNQEAHPLLHYLTHFQENGIQPNRFFNNDYVRETQCLLQDDEPLSYYMTQLKIGGFDFLSNGFSPSPFFDRDFYLTQNGDLKELIEQKLMGDILAHYIKHGEKEGRQAYALQSYNEFVRHQRSYLEPFNFHSHFGSKDSLQHIKGEKAEVAYFEGQKVLTDKFSYQPLISILVPVYQVNPRFLEEMIVSVIAQTYDNWQLCLVDDASKRYQKEIHHLLEQYASKEPRIVYHIRRNNGHIFNTTNDCLNLAKGDYVALLDHDDLLTPDALYEIALALNNNQKLDILYSDEDKVDEWGVFSNPYYKPDWSPHSLWSRMYTCHLTVYRKSLIDDVAGFRVGFEGSQDYDLMLRCSEKTQYIHHIKKVLYHWRSHSESTAGSGDVKNYCVDAGYKAVQEALSRRGLVATIDTVGDSRTAFWVKPNVIDSPSVDIIIPSFNNADILEMCLQSIFEKTTYQNFKITVIDNNSYESDFFTLIDYWKAQEPSRFQVIHDQRPFNFSTINNSAVQNTDGDYLVFLNNDTEVITEDWLEGMLGYAQLEEVGAVGVELLYPDNTIQHAGVAIGLGGVAGHVMKHFKHDLPGYFFNLKLVTNYSAVTAACLMIKREKFNSVSGFEEYLQIAFNDVDFCLKVRQQALYNVYLPFVELYHHESKSRGYENTPEKQARFEQEILFMRQRWGKLLDNDPFYSPWLALDKEDMSYRFH